MHRFYVETPVSSNKAYLAGSEAHHLIHVLRASVGMEVVLIDGSGAEFDARVLRIERRGVELEVIIRHAIDRELSFPFTLGVTLPKGDRQRWLVEKAVELGVQTLVPLQTERSVLTPTSTSLSRLRKVVIESSKQCGRNQLMQIDTPQSLETFQQRPPQESLQIVAHPTSGIPVSSIEDLRSSILAEGRPVFAAVGPEGGFSDQEFADFQGASWQAVSMGLRILRIETAAISLVAALTLR